MADVNLNQLWARALLEELVRGGVREAVVCPGSRSAPLALACAAQPDLRTFSVIDERSAGFFALGLGKESGRPALLVATSGTAAAHFYPAVIEAFMARVPLLVLSADRPWELQGFGAPQTIDQGHLYGRFSRGYFGLGLPEASAPVLAHLRAVAGEALALAWGAPAGPVQLNAPLREPLAPLADAPPLPTLPLSAREGRAQGPWVLRGSVERRPAARVLQALRERLGAAERGVIVCGPRDPRDGFPDAVLRLGRVLGFPVLAEAASQVRGSNEQPGPITLYDSLLRHAPFARAHTPELVLRFGGGLTSKRLQAWLDEAPAELVLCSEQGARFDPAHKASWLVEGDATLLCDELTGHREGARSAWLSAFQAAERTGRQALDEAFGASDALTEPRVAYETLSALPSNAQLFVSSSMPVRDVDAFAHRCAPGVRVLSNRGVNGIDGVLSSALGAAAASGRPTVALVGDLAFLHDLTGLLTARRHGIPLTVVVVNNDGGGIFSFLPIARFPEHFEPLFGTPHGLKAASLAEPFGARCLTPSTPAQLRSQLQGSLGQGLTLLEVQTRRDTNPGEHELLHGRVAQALGAGPWE